MSLLTTTDPWRRADEDTDPGKAHIPLVQATFLGSDGVEPDEVWKARRMTPYAGDLMRHLLDAGVTLAIIAGGRLHLGGRRPPDALLAEARERRDELIALLSLPCVDCGAPLPAGHVYRCDAYVTQAWRETGS
jgi:hypothetical protein